MKKIIFCDYDGTFFTDDKSAQQNAKAVKRFRKQGGKFVIATGRGLSSIRPMIREYSISFDYLILNNGAFITNGNEEIIFQKTISRYTAEKASDFMKENFNDILEGVYFYGFGDKTKTPEGIITKMRGQTIGKSRDSAENLEQAINSHFPSLKAHATWTDLYPEIDYQIVDIMNAETGKDSAIDFILELEGLGAKDATAIGDGRNDVDMVQRFKGYAMKHSEDILKSVASGIVDSVEELIDSLI
jgi:HAD-superfamily hydrolase, subfamily IIB